MLRRATWRDCLWVRRLRNEPDVAAWSRGGCVPPWRHLWWWWAEVRTGRARVWVWWQGDARAGYVRLSEDAEVSVAVAPAFRQQGIGFRLVCSLTRTARAPLWASIHMDNEPSRGLFSEAGFGFQYREGDWYRYAYRPDPPR